MRFAWLVVIVFLAGCLGTSPGGPAPTTSPAPSFQFLPPMEVKPVPDGVGSEPSLLAAKDGSLYVVSVLGSATAKGDGLWKSKDAGATWAYLGKPDYPYGGGDADLDEDATGALYLPGQWRTLVAPAGSPASPYVTSGESVAVSTDHGATWTQYPVASYVPVVDRQWTATYKTGNVWLSFNQAQLGLVVTHSTDSGRTWTPLKLVPGTSDPGDGVAVSGGPNGIPGDWLVDPNDGTLFLPYSPGIGGGSQEHRLFISKDGGNNFDVHVMRRAPDGEQAGAIFGSLAMDTQGGLYYAWAESVAKGDQGVKVFLSTSRDHGVTWSAPQRVSPSNATAVFPWVVAGAPGHVAVAFYATDYSAKGFLSDGAPKDARWTPRVAITQDAMGAAPAFQTLELTPKPNHIGPLCTGGTGCDPQYRQLGDFFEAALTADGKVVVVWVDDIGATRTQFVALQANGSLLSG